MIHFSISPDTTADTAEERLKHTLFIVEGSSYRLWCQHSAETLFPPWNQREDKRAYPARKWEQVTSNPVITVGYFGKRPINLSTAWYRIDGQWVMFWEACSQVVDHKLIDAWFDKHFTGTYDRGTRRASGDEGNFDCCLDAIDEANKPGYTKPAPLKTAAQMDEGFVSHRFKVVKCEGKDHVRGDEGCVCHLIGKTVTIRKRYDTPFVGTASYWLRGHRCRVRRSELGLPDVRACS